MGREESSVLRQAQDGRGGGRAFWLNLPKPLHEFLCCRGFGFLFAARSGFSLAHAVDADGNGEARGVIGAGAFDQAVFGHAAAVAGAPFLQGGLGVLALAGLATLKIR